MEVDALSTAFCAMRPEDALAIAGIALRAAILFASPAPLGGESLRTGRGIDRSTGRLGRTAGLLTSGRGVIMSRKGKTASQTPINNYVRCPLALSTRKKPRKLKLLTLFSVVLAHNSDG